MENHLPPDLVVRQFEIMAARRMAELKMKSGFGCPETRARSHLPRRTTLSPRFHFAGTPKGIELKQAISLYVSF